MLFDAIIKFPAHLARPTSECHQSERSTPSVIQEVQACTALPHRLEPTDHQRPQRGLGHVHVFRKHPVGAD